MVTFEDIAHSKACNLCLRKFKNRVLFTLLFTFVYAEDRQCMHYYLFIKDVQISKLSQPLRHLTQMRYRYKQKIYANKLSFINQSRVGTCVHSTLNFTNLFNSKGLRGHENVTIILVYIALLLVFLV